MLSLRWLSVRRLGAAAALVVVLAPGVQRAAPASDILDPNDIPKFVQPLVIPPVMPPKNDHRHDRTKYEIAVKQFQQQVLPKGFPMTTVWGYGDAKGPDPGEPGSTYHFPAFTIEARSGERVRVKWINGLMDEKRHFLPHLLPVDQTLHWANPPGPPDSKGTDPEPYLGPVPIVTHVHGAHVPDHSDGYPEAWYLPKARNIPHGYHKKGSHYQSRERSSDKGAAVFEYPNDQRASTLWYHDHALGITRLNVYTGMAGFWLLRDEVEDDLDLPGPAPRLGDKPGTHYYEIPLAIQDRSFNTDGSLFYPDSRAFFDGFEGPYIPDPDSDVSPIWNPEFFGNAFVVNGRTWPDLEVEPRLYRFRFLNGCNSRFLILRFGADIPFHQIGAEGGLLPGAPIVLDELLMAPAERADVIVDFSGFKPGQTITLLNLGPDAPFSGLPVDPADLADPATTGQVMRFTVVPLTDHGNPGVIPTSLPPIDTLDTDLPARDLTLNEEVSSIADIPIAAFLGTGADGPLAWDDDISETPRAGDTEVWRILNLTADAHPVHLHLVMFQVIDRIPFDADAYALAQEDWLAGHSSEPPIVEDFYIGDPIPPNAWETGWKDTVIANPGEVTRIIATFDLPGLYVWHCHILEHEDNEMMRAYRVLGEDDDHDDHDDDHDEGRAIGSGNLDTLQPGPGLN